MRRPDRPSEDRPQEHPENGRGLPWLVRPAGLRNAGPGHQGHHVQGRAQLRLQAYRRIFPQRPGGPGAEAEGQPTHRRHGSGVSGAHGPRERHPARQPGVRPGRGPAGPAVRGASHF